MKVEELKVKEEEEEEESAVAGFLIRERYVCAWLLSLRGFFLCVTVT